MKRWKIRNDKVFLEFQGELVAESASNEADDERERWIEFRLYRTREGRYILAREGHSRIASEITRYFACVCEEPEGVRQTLYLEDGDGALYLTNVAKKLLERAAREDERIREELRIERVS